MEGERHPGPVAWPVHDLRAELLTRLLTWLAARATARARRRRRHGSQVAYNGHLLYTFITDRPGQVTGQGVQNFFVATPGIARLSGSSAPTGTVPASPSGPAAGGYGY